MFSTLGLRLKAAVAHVVARARSLLRETIRPFPLVAGALKDLTRSREQLIAENALLRQQLIVASRKVKRPVFRAHERGLVVVLSHVVRGWRDALLLVKPETILRWHREGFRLFWRWKSRCRTAPEQKISEEVKDLIRRMARDNRLWGAEPIRGELLKLGITVAKRTIQRYLRVARPAVPPRGQSWKTFLGNHTVWACDFLQVYDLWFRPLFAFFVIDIKSGSGARFGTLSWPGGYGS